LLLIAVPLKKGTGLPYNPMPTSFSVGERKADKGQARASSSCSSMTD